MFMLVGQPSKVTVKSTGVDATRLFYFTHFRPHGECAILFAVNRPATPKGTLE